MLFARAELKSLVYNNNITATSYRYIEITVIIQYYYC